MTEEITQSCGNVFEDLGFDAPEAAVLRLRASLMGDLRAYLETSGLNPTEASQRLGLSKTRLAELQRGEWEHFSLEMLVTLEARLGRKIGLQLAA